MRSPSKRKFSMKRGLTLGVLVILAGSSVALAQESDGTQKPEPKDTKEDISLGLAPGTPQVGALPGGITPAYGQRALDEGEWRFDFHGFLTMPLRAGLNTRAGAVTTEQHTNVLHAPPVVPEYRDAFTYTSAIPQPYAQLNFSYGNSVVTGNVILLARTATNAASYYNPPEQSGISDAFVNFRLPHLVKNVHVDINVGALTNRYGVMGEYDEGKYGTLVIGRVNGVGEHLVAKLAVGDAVLALEHGFQGQFDRFPSDTLPAGWNGFASPQAGSGFVNHLHAGVAYLGTATLGLHFLDAWSQDDRAAQSFVPDGKLRVLGADLRLTTGNVGHVYLAFARADATAVASLGRILELMNTGGGAGLVANYFGAGSGGNGSLTTFAAQYDVSLQSLLKYPAIFNGESQDVVLSLFAIGMQVGSKDAAVDGLRKLKAGGEVGASLNQWFAASFRFDRVVQDLDDASQSFSIFSPRLIFRSKWNAHDQVVLQYSRFQYGSNVLVRSGAPAAYDPTIRPDRDVISLSASMWW
jgi:hypothetical protein